MSSVDARRAAAALPSVRDQRLDMFRGLALVMIFVNHAPGTIYENWTRAAPKSAPVALAPAAVADELALRRAA